MYKFPTFLRPLFAATVVADRVDDPPARGDGGADPDLQPVPHQPAPRLHHLLPPQAARRVHHQGRLQSIKLDSRQYSKVITQKARNVYLSCNNA